MLHQEQTLCIGAPTWCAPPCVLDPQSLSLTLFKDCDTAAAPRRGDERQPRSIGTLVGLGLALGGGVGPTPSCAALLPLLLPPACSLGGVCKGASAAQDGLGVVCTAKCALSAVAAVSTAPSRL